MTKTLRLTLAAGFAGTAAPAFAAGGNIPFFSLFNTNFVVLVAFIVFLAVLVVLRVPGKLAGMLDARAENIRKELEAARKMREEAQALLSSYERKQRDVREQADRIVANARTEAAAAAEKAKADLQVAIARRLQSAEEQIASAEAAAIREVKNRAAEVAVQVAGEVLARQMDAARANALIDDAISTVQSKLH